MILHIVTGERGAGKTTFVLDCAHRATDAGWRVGGVVAPVVWHDGRRIGYDLVDLRSGTRCVLARTEKRRGCQTNIGPYWFDDDAIERGNAAISTAVTDGLEFIAVDEVGPLEFAGQGWAPGFQEALFIGTPAQTLVVAVRPSLVSELPVRFPSGDWEKARQIPVEAPQFCDTLETDGNITGRHDPK